MFRFPTSIAAQHATWTVASWRIHDFVHSNLTVFGRKFYAAVRFISESRADLCSFSGNLTMPTIQFEWCKAIGRGFLKESFPFRRFGVYAARATRGRADSAEGLSPLASCGTDGRTCPASSPSHLHADSLLTSPAAFCHLRFANFSGCRF
jgi:hypothetical protein